MEPKTEAELAEIVANAKGGLLVQGAGTRGVTTAGEKLSVAGLSGVDLYEPGALTMVVRAGTPVAEVEAVLAGENQRLAFEPMDHRVLVGTAGEPTIGGVVAGNISGPRRISVGAARDFLLGVRFIDGSGTVIRNGGRVMKNVTGYDLVKLMAGSWGTLGVLTEVALKVLPRPEATGVLLIEELDDVRAIKALSAALTSPFEVTGAAHTPKGIDGAPVTMIRVEGFEDSVAYRAGALKQLLGDFGEIAVETNPDRTAAGWKWVRDVEAFGGRSGNVWRFSVRPTDGPALGQALREACGAELLYDWGGGLVWALVPEGYDARALAYRGHATLVRAPDETRARLPRFEPEPAPLAAISAGLRARFDPRGILNPGLMQQPVEA